MGLSGMQEDEEWPTGRVTVTLEGGEPDYRIDHPAAWDRIEPLAEPVEAGLVYHGSLALRDADSRQALSSLLSSTAAPVFVDINLRAPWWRRETVLDAVRRANWVKLNQQELSEIAPQLGPEGFIETFALDGLILTLGAAGARCLTADGGDVSVVPTVAARVVDTVGAGDALTSVMICGILQGWPPALALARAQEFASGICAQRGATVRDPGFYRHFLEQWVSG